LSGYNKNLTSAKNKIDGVKYLTLLHVLSADLLKSHDKTISHTALHANIKEIYAFQKKHSKFRSEDLTPYLISMEKLHDDYTDADYYQFFDQVNHENYRIGEKAEILFSEDREQYFLGTLITHYLPEFIISLGISHNLLEKFISLKQMDRETKAIYIEQNKLIHLSSEELANIINLLRNYADTQNLQNTMHQILDALLQLKESEHFEFDLKLMHILVGLAETLNDQNTNLLEKLLKDDEKIFSEKIAYYTYLLIFIIFLVSGIFVYFFRIFNANMQKDIKLREMNNSLEGKIKEEVQKNRDKDKQLIQQSRLAQMGEMISMIAHQWRQPLSAISATSALLELKAKLHQLEDDSVEQKAKDISNYAYHLSVTIDDFRNFFKPNKEKNKTTYDDIVKSVRRIIEISLVNKNIQFRQELNCHKPFTTYSNELKQVVLNLIKNAEDALLENAVKNPYIQIVTYVQNDKYILEVSDNGGGIPHDILDNIFDPYFSTKDEKNGTGIGLYMSKTIIEEHCGGKLNVKNDSEGAVFSIII